MRIERAEHSTWLSNAYLVWDEASKVGVLVDGHGEEGPLLALIEAEGITIDRILLTHFHVDHVVLSSYAVFDVPVLATRETADRIGGGVVSELFADGDVLHVGGMEIEVIATPGHAAGHVALAFDGDDVITADVLFKGTVGGTRGPGATGYVDLRHSIMERLLTMGEGTRLHPGHCGPTTVGDELDGNPFVQIWRGRADEGDEQVKVKGVPATLVLWAPDYDGTNKAWVRFADGEDAVVGGSQVER